MLLTCLIPYRTQVYKLRDGMNHNGPGPPSLIPSQENDLQLDVMEAFPLLRLLTM